MPVVIDPSKLTYLINTPLGQVRVAAPVAVALNDLFQGAHELQKQTGLVLPKRLARATGYRARYKDAVRV